MAVISKFISETKLNFVFSNLYRVEITKSINTFGQKPGLEQQPRRDLISLCNSAQIPGETMATTEKALDFKSRAKQRLYDDITLTFYCTEDMEVFHYFNNWLSEIISEETNRVGFQKDYIATINVHKLGKDISAASNPSEEQINNRIISTTTILEAFPKRVEPISLDYAATGIVNTLSVNFAYTSHYHKIVKYPQPDKEQRILNTSSNIERQ